MPNFSSVGKQVPVPATLTIKSQGKLLQRSGTSTLTADATILRIMYSVLWSWSPPFNPHLCVSRVSCLAHELAQCIYVQVGGATAGMEHVKKLIDGLKSRKGIKSNFTTVLLPTKRQ